MKRILLSVGLIVGIMTLNTDVSAQTFITFGHAAQPPELLVGTSSDVTICNGNTTILTANPVGGTGTYGYTWAPGATLSSTTNDTTTASPTSNQTYTVTVDDDRNCTASDNVVVTVIDCSGLDQIDEIEALNLYPNPSEGMVNLGITFKKKPATVILQIFNMSGQLVMTRDYSKPGLQLADSFDLTNAAPGNYLMRISVGSHSLTKSFIIK